MASTARLYCREPFIFAGYLNLRRSSAALMSLLTRSRRRTQVFVSRSTSPSFRTNWPKTIAPLTSVNVVDKISIGVMGLRVSHKLCLVNYSENRKYLGYAFDHNTCP